MTTDESKIIEGFRFAESIRTLDDRTALKIALTLAGTNPELFSQLLAVVKKQNLVIPKSTYELYPVPTTPSPTPSTRTGT